jgi:hypothetical protein
MIDKDRQRLHELCDQAAKEQDAKKLIQLIGVINGLLNVQCKSPRPDPSNQPKHDQPAILKP